MIIFVRKMSKYIAILLLLTLFLACKKTEDTPSNEPIPESETPVSSTSNYDALFSCIQTYSKISGSYALSGMQTVGYYSSKLINNETYYSSDLKNIGTVSLNSVILKNKNSFNNFYYNDTSGTNFAAPYFWKILGSADVDSFSYSNSNTPPNFPLSANIPDSLQLNLGLNIRLKGLSNCDLIRVYISDNHASINKLVAGNDTIVYLNPIEMETLTPTHSGLISLQFYKNNYRKINNKKINFRTGISFSNGAFKIN
jgi:hypothetical protein